LPDTIVQPASFNTKIYLPNALGYRDAMVSGEKRFTATIYGVETELPNYDFRAGTFAQLQQKLVDLGNEEKSWIDNALADTGLFPSLLDGKIKPNPNFTK